MTSWGYGLVFLGAFLLVVTGLFFYNYFQQIITAAATGATTPPSTTIANGLGVYNGTVNMPIFITLSFFGVAFLIMGAILLVGGHIGEHLGDQLSNPRFDTPQTIAPTPSRACTKCGSLVYQNTAYCPNCGGSLARVQSLPAPAV